MKTAALLLTLTLLTGCGMSYETRKAVFGYDPASEEFFDWSKLNNPQTLGFKNHGRMACQRSENRIVTVNGVEDEYRYGDCPPVGPTDSPQRFGTPGPDQASIPAGSPTTSATEGLNNIPYPYNIENRY